MLRSCSMTVLRAITLMREFEWYTCPLCTTLYTQEQSRLPRIALYKNGGDIVPTKHRYPSHPGLAGFPFTSVSCEELHTSSRFGRQALVLLLSQAREYPMTGFSQLAAFNRLSCLLALSPLSGPPTRRLHNTFKDIVQMPTKDDAREEINSLTFVLVDPEGKDDHYAIVPFPETYEDAKAAAVEALGAYMDDSNDIVLRRSLRNRKGEWVWADIPAKHWKTMIGAPSKEVGVFARPRIAPEPFVHGPLHFAYSRDGGRGISWSSISKGLPSALHPQGIDRPKTFAEAAKVVRTKLSVYLKPLAGPDDTLTFCIFPHNDLFTWIPIPEAAHTDDALWQTLVPQPGGILGVIVNRRV
ncbi:hypothetical protein LshimejAT787_0605500 [Lyophyllum shimeji]|uniref:Uncharacterized protein n=1 Tax=Lyophyllum shimeji TaxID=47721 RepID=A0A9P3PNZ3_LYOSH|nr:hypothetical protein LshimejAT787_0605500 [Lyophyllum shimeji]